MDAEVVTFYASNFCHYSILCKLLIYKKIRKLPAPMPLTHPMRSSFCIHKVAHEPCENDRTRIFIAHTYSSQMPKAISFEWSWNSIVVARSARRTSFSHVFRAPTPDSRHSLICAASFPRDFQNWKWMRIRFPFRARAKSSLNGWRVVDGNTFRVAVMHSHCANGMQTPHTMQMCQPHMRAHTRTL